MENTGDRAVSSADLTIPFEVNEKKVTASAAPGLMEIGAMVRMNVLIPEWASGWVAVKTVKAILHRSPHPTPAAIRKSS